MRDGDAPERVAGPDGHRLLMAGAARLSRRYGDHERGEEQQKQYSSEHVFVMLQRTDVRVKMSGIIPLMPSDAPVKLCIVSYFFFPDFGFSSGFAAFFAWSMTSGWNRLF